MLVVPAFLLPLPILGVSRLSVADEVISPPDSQLWGDEDAAQALLKMNHDPEALSNDPEDPSGWKPPLRSDSQCLEKDKGKCPTSRHKPH